MGFAFLRLRALAGSWSRILGVVRPGRDGSLILFRDSPPLLSHTPISFPTYGLTLLDLWPWGCCPWLPWQSFSVRVTASPAIFSLMERMAMACCPRGRPLSLGRVCSAFSVHHSTCRPGASVYLRGRFPSVRSP